MDNDVDIGIFDDVGGGRLAKKKGSGRNVVVRRDVASWCRSLSVFARGVVLGGGVYGSFAGGRHVAIG